MPMNNKVRYDARAKRYASMLEKILYRVDFGLEGRIAPHMLADSVLMEKLVSMPTAGIIGTRLIELYGVLVAGDKTTRTASMPIRMHSGIKVDILSSLVSKEDEKKFETFIRSYVTNYIEALLCMRAIEDAVPAPMNNVLRMQALSEISPEMHRAYIMWNEGGTPLV